MRTTPFPTDLFQEVHPHHQVLLSCKTHRPGCHQWRPAQTLAEEVRQLNADVIVERYLDAKYYHYDPVELNDLADFNANAANLPEEDNIVAVENAVTDEYNLSASVKENFKELESACPESRTSPVWTSNQRQELPSLWRKSRKQSGSLAKQRRTPTRRHAC